MFINKIINFFEIIFFFIICYFYITYNNFLSHSLNLNYNNNLNHNNYISKSSSLNNEDLDEIYFLKHQRKILIDLLKDKQLNYMKNKFLNDIHIIDERLSILNADMDDLDIIIL